MSYLESNKGTNRGVGGLAALFKPVTTTPTCRAFYDGRCYIPRSADLREEHLNSSISEKRTSETQLAEATSEPWSPEGFGVENYVTLVCLSFSMSCLALKIFVYCAFRESRGFTSKCTLCLSLTLLVTHAVFVATNFVDLSAAACVASAVLVHYGILSTLCWTCALSFDVYRCLTVLKVSSNRDSTLVAYGIFSWGAPLAIVSAAMAVDGAASGSFLSPSYGSLTCWIGTFWGLVLYFLAPAFVLLLSCLIFYFMTASYIGTASLALSAAEDTRTTRERTHATLFLRLALIMGSPWPVAFLATFVQSKALDTVVNALVGLQGVYLFLIFQDYRHFWRR
ncbi:probable G-protein coupled receptor Mth-like 2 [Dermacentor andersoni]|uniref:probable G-protein coupled receptor Mth-like 2 n=1 Tax=Dermacentor andersoni TaxID=34620 RepID=UPI003B3A6DD7